MPYCNECGDLYVGNGIYCHAHKSSSQASSSSLNSTASPNSTTQPVVRQANHQVFGRTGSLSESIIGIASDPGLCSLLDFLTIDAQRGRVIAVLKNNRVQCNWCESWFATQKMLDRHNDDYPSGCAVHGVCFEKSDNVVHATRHTHERCFVLGCKSIYMTEEGWKDSVIVAHIRKEHSH